MVFHTKPMLQYLGRYYLIALFCGLPVIFCWLFYQIWLQDGFQLIFLLIIPITWLSLWCLNQLWEKLFAKLIIKDDRIMWRCIFRRSHTLFVAECRWVGVELEDSFNGLDYPYVYFSREPYPAEYQHKINKVKCTDNFIKFWYSEQLVNYLESHIAPNRVGALVAYREKCKRAARGKAPKKKRG